LYLLKPFFEYFLKLKMFMPDLSRIRTRLYLVSLGCVRNLVDSEFMLGRLVKAGFAVTPNPADADIIIVNTCGFIESAVNESIDTILELAEFKQSGRCQKLIVAGCLPERFREKIVQALPEVDLFLGTGACDRIVEAVEKAAVDGSRCFLPDPNLIGLDGHGQPRLQSTSHTAYLKISVGCDKHCTYCIIPKLRGRQRSRRPEDIVAEARALISSGVKELILVAEDTTAYGKDLTPSPDLAGLLVRISEMADSLRSCPGEAGGSGRVWLRFLYGHPESMDDAVIRAVAANQNICSYFDLPIQHAGTSVLKKMGRNYTHDDLVRLFGKIRSLVPDAVLRTTVITGFPGETDNDFEQLLNFVETIGFDHLGVFTYSDSEDLPAHRLSGHVPKRVAQKRYERLMASQARISLENNQKRIGKTYTVLVEEKTEDNRYMGRTFFQAPEVDGITYIHAGQLQAGDFADVRIIDAREYDLVGDVV
jgi:ribosomal protein S12 methylthiotransferase